MYEQYSCSCSRINHSAQDVSLAAMFVSAKMHDTLKKPRELLAVSYAIRFPDLAAKSKHLGGDVDLDTMDPSVRSFCNDFSFRVRFLFFLPVSGSR
jgi:CTD kinase subunit beta